VNKHSGIGLENDNPAAGDAEIHAAIIQVNPCTGFMQRGEQACAQHRFRVLEKLGLLCQFPAVALHVRGEIMHQPVGRNRQMIRVGHAIDEDHTVFARTPVSGAAVVE